MSAIALSAAMPTASLRNLNLEYNFIGAASCDTRRDTSHNDVLEGFQALGSALKQNITLTSLNVSSNRMGPKGAAAFADGMANGSLRTLDLSNNEVVGVPVFVAASRVVGTDLSPGSKVTLDGNEMTVLKYGIQQLEYTTRPTVVVRDWSGILAIAQALKVPSRIETLILDKNSLSSYPDSKLGNTEYPEGMQALGEGFRMNTTLQCLSLKCTNLGPLSASALGILAVSNGLLPGTIINITDLVLRR